MSLRRWHFPAKVLALTGKRFLLMSNFHAFACLHPSYTRRVNSITLSFDFTCFKSAKILSQHIKPKFQDQLQFRDCHEARASSSSCSRPQFKVLTNIDQSNRNGNRTGRCPTHKPNPGHHRLRSVTPILPTLLILLNYPQDTPYHKVSGLKLRMDRNNGNGDPYRGSGRMCNCPSTRCSSDHITFPMYRQLHALR